MKNKETELVFILDKSGSMAGLEADSIGGYNSMLEKQRKEEGAAFVTTVLFHHEVQMLHDGIPLQEVANLRTADYVVGGMTALLDAIGSTILTIKERQQEKGRKVLFVISTDGMENASKEFTATKVKDLIAQQQAEADWSFIFLGANIDAISEAKKYGIDRDFAVNYHADAQGIQSNYDAIHEAASAIRQGKSIDQRWKTQIEKDFETRSRGSSES